MPQLPITSSTQNVVAITCVCAAYVLPPTGVLVGDGEAVGDGVIGGTGVEVTVCVGAGVAGCVGAGVGVVGGIGVPAGEAVAVKAIASTYIAGSALPLSSWMTTPPINLLTPPSAESGRE